MTSWLESKQSVSCPNTLESAKHTVYDPRRLQTGRIADADVDAARRAGLSDTEIAEVIAQVALNIFTHYFNNATDVEVDFPKIALRKSA